MRRRRQRKAESPCHERALAARCCEQWLRRRCRPRETLNARCVAAGLAAEVIAAALRAVGRDQLALVSSFGTESAALLKVMADVDPAIPVIFLDTGWLFEETLAYRDTLIATLGLRDVRSIKPLRGQCSIATIPSASCGSPIRTNAASSARSSRWRARLQPFAAWINGRKRFQGGAARRHCRWSKTDGARLKFNPFANVSREDIEAIYATGEAAAASAGRIGLSVGRLHAVHQPRHPDEDARAGRWRGRAKTECGIHTMKTS